jgi:hypothetical protein
LNFQRELTSGTFEMMGEQILRNDHTFFFANLELRLRSGRPFPCRKDRVFAIARCCS